MSAAAQGLGAKRWNKLSDNILQWALDTSDSLLHALLADGYPPGAQMASPYQQFLNLQQLAEQVGGPVNLPLAAQERLYQLSLEFGEPGSPLGQQGTIQGQPFEPSMPLNLRGLARATFTEQQDQQGG